MPEPLFVAPGITIPGEDLEVAFSRSGGPGGQHLQKTETRVQLRLDLEGTRALPPDVKARIRTAAPGRVTRDGGLVLASDRHREQHRNLEEVRRRLAALVRSCLEPPPVRRPTRPSQAQRRRRLEEKVRRGRLKQARGPVRDGE